MATLASPDFNTSNPSPFSPFFPDQIVTSQEKKDISSIYIYFACLLVFNKRQTDGTTFFMATHMTPGKVYGTSKLNNFVPPKMSTKSRYKLWNLFKFVPLTCPDSLDHETYTKMLHYK